MPVLILSAIILTLIVYVLGYQIGLLISLSLLFLPIFIFIYWRYPEIGIFLILILVSFGSEYSQTDWGVRSAEEFKTIYNYRLVSSIPVSLFDIIFLILVGMWLIYKFLNRQRLLFTDKNHILGIHF